jgi:membrane associated rhomboid family serine protease
MRRYPHPTYDVSFGPGMITPAVKALIWMNVVAFVVSWFVPALITWFGLTPAAVFQRLFVWQPVSYLFLHGSFGHILINMLILWMFGVELERLWGTRFFLRYYFVTGIGAAAATLAVSLLPAETAARMYVSPTIGASGAIYGLLMAFAIYYPTRPILMFFLIPVPAKYFVMILGAIAFMAATGPGDGVAHTAHLGGLIVGYIYLRRGRLPFGFGRAGVKAELKYRYMKWKMSRLRKRFEMHTGGRSQDWDGRIH